jgi:hypothetical protein
MAEQPEPVAQQGPSVDMNKVFASYERQISAQAGSIAIKEAIIETQREEIAELKKFIDGIRQPAVDSVSLADVMATKRTTPKGKKK